MEKIHIKTSKEYDILLGEEIIYSLPRILMPFCKTKKILIITDKTVDKLYGNHISENLTVSGYDVKKYVFSGGEASKNIETLSDILEFAAKNDIKRNDLFLALGGGVVGDITGLAAALYMRGVNVVQMPTTLLSAVDSSVGGKTAVNLKSGKNLVGAFKQPSLVIIDTDIIKKLPKDIFYDGMGEVIKCGIIKNSEIFEFIENGTVFENLTEIIKHCLLLKKEIVEKDEFDEKGIRNILNAGHTIAHSLEVSSGFTIAHGKAVAFGCLTEAKIANKLNICDEKTVKIIENAVKKCGLYFETDFDKTELAKNCIKDKKNEDSKIIFLLPESIGNIKKVKLSADDIEKLL